MRRLIVTRGFPIGDTIPAGHEHDPSLEPHQRAMYFGHGDINGFNFWAEEVFSKYYGNGYHSAFGQMVFRRIEEIRPGPASVSFALRSTSRDRTANRLPKKFNNSRSAAMVTHGRSTVSLSFARSRTGQVWRHEGGHFRPSARSRTRCAHGNHGNSEGGEGEAQIWGKRANWVDVDGVIDGQALGVAIFDHPKSFRHPLLARPRLWIVGCESIWPARLYHDPHQDGSYTIPVGGSIQFRYRVFIHDGNYKQAHVGTDTEYAANE